MTRARVLRRRVARVLGILVALPAAFFIWLGLVLYEWGAE